MVVGRRDSASGERRGCSAAGEEEEACSSARRRSALWGGASGAGVGSAGVEDLENQEDQAREDWGAVAVVVAAGVDGDPVGAGSAGACFGGGGGSRSLPELPVAPISSSRNLLTSGSTSGPELEPSFRPWAGCDGACGGARGVLCDGEEGFAEAGSCQNQPMVSCLVPIRPSDTEEA